MVGEDLTSRRIDVLAIGLFGLAVGALTLGVAQLGRTALTMYGFFCSFRLQYAPMTMVMRCFPP